MIRDSLEAIIKKDGWELIGEEDTKRYFQRGNYQISIADIKGGFVILYMDNGGRVLTRAEIKGDSVDVGTKNFKKYGKEVVEIMKYIAKAME